MAGQSSWKNWPGAAVLAGGAARTRNSLYSGLAQLFSSTSANWQEADKSGASFM